MLGNWVQVINNLRIGLSRYDRLRQYVMEALEQNVASSAVERQLEIAGDALR
jgi:hypothetical protein